MKKSLRREDMLHLGSLITYQVEGAEKETCLGYLMDFEGKGVFDPEFGKVDVTPEEAKAHNKALDEAMLEGLDKNCEIGYGGTFYFTNSGGKKENNFHRVSTFMGTTVSDDITLTGETKTSITFRRGGKSYRGRLRKDVECFNFRRVK